MIVAESAAPHGAVLLAVRNTYSCGTGWIDDSKPLFLCTHVDFQQRECGSVFALESYGYETYLPPAPAEVQLVLRNVSFTPLSGCDVTRLASEAFSGNIQESITECGASYLDPMTLALASVCAPHASCTVHSVPGTPLRGPRCECTSPDFADPAFDPVLAMYSVTEGCIRPRALTDLVNIARDVTVVLARPNDTARALNLTLEMRGSDPKRPAWWCIANAVDLAPW
eukprot:3981515-Prymnesium_polylepis.1